MSQPAHQNAEPILASCVPRLQFPYRTLPWNPFLLPCKGFYRSRFWIPLPVKVHVTIDSASQFTEQPQFNVIVFPIRDNSVIRDDMDQRLDGRMTRATKLEFRIRTIVTYYPID